VPSLLNDVEASVKLGGLLWLRFAAIAAVRSTYRLTWSTVCWRSSFIPLPSSEPPAAGRAVGLPSSREGSAVLMFHSGIQDRMAARRFYLPAPPRSWSAGGLLTEEGMGNCESLAQLAMMGFGGHLLSGTIAGLIAYHGELPPTFENPSGTCFRTLQYVAVCSHTERQPDYSLQPWP
jgi:hypothetical protein